MNRPSASTLPLPENEAAASDTTRGVTPRVVVLSLLLAAFFGYAIPFVDFKFTNTFLGAAHLPPGAIAALLILLLVVNPLLKLLSRRLAFRRNELLTVYITSLFSVLVPGRGGENFFIPNIIGSFYYATSGNKWFDFLGPYLKPWMTPAFTAAHTYNEDVVSPWYLGLAPGASIPWGAWLVPLIACSIPKYSLVRTLFLNPTEGQQIVLHQQ